MQDGWYRNWGMYWCHCPGVRSPAAEQIRWMAYWTFRFQSRIVPSSLLVASVCPSGLNATQSTGTVLTVRGGPSGRGRTGLVTSHRWTVPSLLALASVCPSGLNATDLITAVPLVRD